MKESQIINHEMTITPMHKRHAKRIKMDVGSIDISLDNNLKPKEICFTLLKSNIGKIEICMSIQCAITLKGALGSKIDEFQSS